MKRSFETLTEAQLRRMINFYGRHLKTQNRGDASDYMHLVDEYVIRKFNLPIKGKVVRAAPPETGLDE